MFTGISTLLPVIFTMNLLYCIINFTASIMSITGFLMMIKLLDRVIQKGRGIPLFLTGGLIKLIVIATLFYLFSKISENAVLFYMLGLSVITLSILTEGGYQLFKGKDRGRA